MLMQEPTEEMVKEWQDIYDKNFWNREVNLTKDENRTTILRKLSKRGVIWFHYQKVQQDMSVNYLINFDEN